MWDAALLAGEPLRSAVGSKAALDACLAALRAHPCAETRAVAEECFPSSDEVRVAAAAVGCRACTGR